MNLTQLQTLEKFFKLLKSEKNMLKLPITIAVQCRSSVLISKELQKCCAGSPNSVTVCIVFIQKKVYYLPAPSPSENNLITIPYPRKKEKLTIHLRIEKCEKQKDK